MSRNDQDPAAQVAGELRARLRTMGGEELVELCAQLLTTYVVEGVVPLARAGEAAELSADSAGEESFAQLLKRLKAEKKDPVLERFFIDGENISVRIDGQGIMPITDYRRPLAPPAAAGVSVQMQPMPRRESVPGGSTSIYNRGLYDNQPPPARPSRSAQPQPAQARPAPAAPGPQQPAAAQPAKKEPEQPKSDRFSLIELE
ncbi:MAG TPA: hypothetical protein VH083_05450 [Myxococcales bacterium]|nr:hypothetical protein [Myxococcales bacterium]